MGLSLTLVETLAQFDCTFIEWVKPCLALVEAYVWVALEWLFRVSDPFRCTSLLTLYTSPSTMSALSRGKKKRNKKSLNV